MSAHQVSRFVELRVAIQKVCCSVARNVYARLDGSTLEYGRVVLVGHSLGSVLAYDMINTVMVNLILGRPNTHVLDAARSHRCEVRCRRHRLRGLSADPDDLSRLYSSGGPV